ncbi:Flp family type IVb pilin [Halobacteriovorax sp. HLS]|uniref:Flp family type IVb pilin n=1 Tax=Halobacteriovorax sp. HLS TaxID=2234000 RepID=UPI000FDBE961|nr:hypothetical protein [Halobacteriovorax sp. HLS]
MDNKRKNLFLNNSGQSAVEYILLLSVISVLTFSIVNSKRFKDFMGPDSSFFAAIRARIEFTYRHGYDNVIGNDKTNNNYTRIHETYYNSELSTTRFFTGADGYPQ